MAFGDEIEQEDLVDAEEGAGEAEEVGEALAADAGVAEEPGVLQRVAEAAGAGVAEALGLNGFKIENAEKWKIGEKKIVDPEAHLGKMERFVLNSLHKAFKDGDAAAVQNLLGALNEKPEMIKSVMYALHNRMAALGIQTSHETGTDNRGNSFLRLHAAGTTGRGESSSVTIGSDGRNSGSVTDRQGNTTPSEAAGTFSSISQWGLMLNQMRPRNEIRQGGRK